MKLRLFGKEKGRSFWLTIACDGFQWHATAYDRLRWHSTASSRTPSPQCPTPKMKPNTLKMPLAIMPTTEKMACVTV